MSLMSKQKLLVLPIPQGEKLALSRRKVRGHPSAISLSLSACPSGNAQ